MNPNPNSPLTLTRQPTNHGAGEAARERGHLHLLRRLAAVRRGVRLPEPLRVHAHHGRRRPGYPVRALPAGALCVVHCVCTVCVLCVRDVKDKYTPLVCTFLRPSCVQKTRLTNESEVSSPVTDVCAICGWWCWASLCVCVGVSSHPPATPTEESSRGACRAGPQCTGRVSRQYTESDLYKQLSHLVRLLPNPNPVRASSLLALTLAGGARTRRG